MSKSVFNSLCARWRGMSAIGRIMAIGAVCVSVLYGGSKGERGSGNGERDDACSQGKREVGIGKSVLSGTNPQAIPTNVNMSSSRARSWSIRGAWDDVFTLKFENDFYFPYGTNLYNAVKVFSQGYVIPFTNPFETYNGDMMTFDKTQGRWDYGMLQWYIQWGWTERNADIDDDPIGIMKERYDQIFYIDEYGTLSIFKFNHNVLRGTNNIIRLNGNIIN